MQEIPRRHAFYEDTGPSKATQSDSPNHSVILNFMLLFFFSKAVKPNECGQSHSVGCTTVRFFCTKGLLNCILFPTQTLTWRSLSWDLPPSGVEHKAQAGVYSLLVNSVSTFLNIVGTLKFLSMFFLPGTVFFSYYNLGFNISRFFCPVYYVQHL